MNALAFDEQGEKILTTEFDYPPEPPDQDSTDAIILTRAQLDRLVHERVLLVMKAVLEWIWQDGMRDARGQMIRSAIACKIFLTQLQPMSLTKLANLFRMKKQSFGRWQDDFKVRFPFIPTVHMKYQSGFYNRLETPGRLPPDLDGLKLLGRVLAHVKRYPVARWSPPCREALRAYLEPLARELWPEKFSES